MSGIVPGHMTLARTIVMILSFIFGYCIIPFFPASGTVIYFALTVVFYLGLISVVLSANGLRITWIRLFGEKSAYCMFEGMLGFAFFHNALGLTAVSKATADTDFWQSLSVSSTLVYLISLGLFVTGTTVKIWSAYILGTELYYWEDMFLRRKVKDCDCRALSIFK